MKKLFEFFMNIFNNFKQAVIIFLALIIIRFITATLQVTIKGDGQHHLENGPPVYAFWHGKQFYFLSLLPRKGLSTMVSLSKDGQLQSSILKKLGVYVARGSSSRGGVTGVLELYKRLKRGNPVCFAVDGPRGPIHVPKAGVLQLAQKTQSKIIPVSAKANNKFVFSKAWDRYELPKPFSKITIVFGEPYYLTEEINDTNLEYFKAELISKINLCTDKCKL